MEYPFKDLMPLDEVLEREGYYKDWTHLDPEVFYSLTQISNFIKTKGYGVDVRLLIAQLAEHFGLKTAQVVDLGNLLIAKHATLKTQFEQAVSQVNAERNALETQFNQSVAQMEADKDAVIANATVDSEVILARGGFGTLGERLNGVENQFSKTVGVSIEDFPRIENETDDIPRFQRAVSSLVEGDRLVIPDGEYLFEFRENSTIENPTRVVVDKDNIEIIGIGKPVIRMVGLTKEYLDSIDDYASSGRDIFTAFSFIATKNSYIENISFIGEHSDGHFRYQSPRSIAVSFKGTENAKAHNITGEGIMGNVINIVNSYIDYDAHYAEAVNTSIADCMAINCLENGFNFMGGTRDSIVANLYAKGCANGLESASKNMIASDCIFDRNRGSAVGISGENTTLNGVIGRNSIGEIGKDNGYGIIMTGGKSLVVNGGDFTSNKSNGLLVYPGCEDITINGADLSLSGEGNQYKININVVGTPEKKIKRLLINGCKINNNLASLGNFNHTESAVVTANSGHTNATSSMIFNAQSTGSVAKNNNFNKPISMGDTSGENHNNGNTRRVERSTIPTSGSWKLGDVVRNTNAGIGTWLEAICVQGGTFGAAQEPIFKINLQNGHRGAVTTKPDFVGQTAQTLGSSPKFYIATGTASASDWQLIVG